MLTDDSLRSADGPDEAASIRRRLLKIAATVAATAPLVALTGGHAAQASPAPSASDSRPIRRAVLVPRFGADASADWYPTALAQLADLGISTKVVPLLPEPTAPGIDQTVTAIARAVGDDSQEIARTILIGHSVGSLALLAYLSRHGRHRTFAGLVSAAGWFTVDDLKSYAALAPWMHMDLNFASIAAAAGPVTVHLSDNDPFTADWRANASNWLGKLGAAVHIAHSAGHYMTTSPGPLLDTIHLASLRTIER